MFSIESILLLDSRSLMRYDNVKTGIHELAGGM